MIRIFATVATFVAVFVSVLALGVFSIGAWLVYGYLGVAALSVVGLAFAVAWAVAERVASTTARQSGLQVRRQVARDVKRKEPHIVVSHRHRYEQPVYGDAGDTIIIDSYVPAHQPSTQEPRLFSYPEDFTIIEWTEDRRRRR
jgi:hypothetical protein